MSGLYYAYKIKKLYPHLSFLILEKYKKNWIGGRTSNDIFYGSEIVTGAGIGREDTNPLLIKLMKELNIPFKKSISIMNYSKTIHNPLDPESVITFLKKEYKKHPNLHSLSFKEFAEKVLGKEKYKDFLISSGYQDFEKADINETLYNYGMDDNKGGWPILYIPWKKLVLTLAENIGWNHFCFSQNVEKIKIKKNPQDLNLFELDCENGNSFFCKKIIIATPINSIQKLIDPLVPNMKSIYNQIHGQPFLRLYGKFDKKSAEIMEKLVPNYMIVPGPLQKIIPMNAEKGIYMISYSDNKNAVLLHKHFSDTQEFKHYVANLICKALGLPKDSLILLGVKEYFWKIGTHYYEPLKNFKSRKEFIYLAQHPMKNILVVGEAVSNYQGWVEGALESVDAVLN
jgi:protoporphyrinogen oxidase